MANLSFTTIKILDIISDFNVYPLPFRKDDFFSAEYVKKLRDETWGRYDQEIENAFDNLYKIPKKRWPKLLKS